MPQIEISYEELEKRIIGELKTRNHGVLATSENDFITAREMGLIFDGLTIYTFTSKDSRKYIQMTKNRNVALSIRNIQVEGTAKLKGHPTDDENTHFREVHQKTLPEVYEMSVKLHFHRQYIRVIEITPTRITRYTNDIESETVNFLEILNIVENKAFKVSGEELSESPAYYL